MVGLLLMFGAIALGVVGLRAEEARTARRIQWIQLEAMAIRRELWSVQLDVARHKSPQRISEGVNRLALEVAAPGSPGPGRSDGLRWASTR